MTSLELKVPPVALNLALMGLAAVADRVASAARIAVPHAGLYASALATAGLVIAILGVISFRRARTTVNPLQPENVSALVVTGIYRVTRNPMYLGLLWIQLGWSVWLGNPVTLVSPVLFVAYMNRFQIHPEERALSARFGPAFAAYQSRVRRWL
ncbi:MAG TPA: isoprenylcysteine carboxylmethyltransferase family protein [Opitutaceae bacterium]|nr:isoprenylcysteine carboxylmethyltransferase family protein [Opitutaceae bacterium]HND63080.1 isoprenylcysteine carboxylmethyltransferase family protein [Opitutaceae bacterium]